MHFFAVMDGHGHFGRNVSQHVTARFPRALEAELAPFKTLESLTDEAVHGILTRAVNKVADGLAQTTIPLQHSGTTFIGSLIFDNRIYTANVGDSQGMLLSSGDDNSVVIKDLNYLHNPDVPTERARIERAGGKVSQIPGLPTQEAGPFRIWLADMSGPGLAMARSIGDSVAHSVGAIHTPTIDKKTIDASCKYCLWASDGVFEFLTTTDVAQHINKNSDLKEMAKSIVKASVRMWRKYDQVVDDITVVILKLPELRVAE
jgi:serine/threonine protein phosphatase PrpC